LSDYNFAFSLFKHWIKDTRDKNLDIPLSGRLTTIIQNVRAVCAGGLTEDELFTKQMEQMRRETESLMGSYNKWRPSFD